MGLWMEYKFSEFLNKFFIFSPQLQQLKGRVQFPSEYFQFNYFCNLFALLVIVGMEAEPSSSFCPSSRFPKIYFHSFSSLQNILHFWNLWLLHRDWLLNYDLILKLSCKAMLSKICNSVSWGRANILNIW